MDICFRYLWANPAPIVKNLIHSRCFFPFFTRRPALNKTCFDMPTIYIPEMVSKPTRCANHIEEVGTEIEKTINQTVQNTLNSLERDCDHIAELVRV